MSKKSIHPAWLDEFPDLPKKLLEKPKLSKPVVTVYDSDEPADLESADINVIRGPLKLGHHLYKNREYRLDLISNKLLGIRMEVNGTEYNLCDISKSGFSYARKIPAKTGIDYNRAKKLVELTTRASMGRHLQANFRTNSKIDSKSVNVSCMLRNHRLMYGLSFEDLEREFTKFLYFKSIRRGKDKDRLFDKMDHLNRLTRQAIKKSCWNDGLAVSLNTTVVNLMKQAGATTETIDSMYDGYKGKPVYVKLGAYLTNENDKQKLMSFVQTVADPNQKIEQPTKKPVAESEPGEISKIATTLVNNLSLAETPAKYKKAQIDKNGLTYRNLLMKTWKSCLVQLKLDLRKPVPKSTNHDLAVRMKNEARLYNCNPAKFMDLCETGNKIALVDFLAEGLFKIVRIENANEAGLIRKVVGKSLRSVLGSAEIHSNK